MDTVKVMPLIIFTTMILSSTHLLMLEVKDLLVIFSFPKISKLVSIKSCHIDGYIV
jgi:hypothetical protein